MVGELRAQHVIHLHRLLREIATHFETECGMPSDRLDDYEDVGVLATDFKATKPEHEAAVMELGDAVGEWAESQLEDSDDDTDREPTPTIKA